MNASEAAALHTLLCWILDGEVSDEQAAEAAAHLAGRAHARLGAGLTEGEVRRAWRQQRPLVITDQAPSPLRPACAGPTWRDAQGHSPREDRG